MKKAAIVTVSIILFVVLIGLNYLLWDNFEKKEDIKSLENKEETRQQSFQDLYDDYKKANNDKVTLQIQINDLEKTIADKNEEIDQLVVNNNNIYTIIGDKNTIIMQFQKHADTLFYKKILENWVESINSKAYFDAYSSHDYKDVFSGRTDINHTIYALKFSNIEAIDVEDFKVRIIDEEAAQDENAKNRISFDALFNVELVKDEDGFPVHDEIFNNGINHFKVTMAFDMETWTWKIWAIE